MLDGASQVDGDGVGGHRLAHVGGAVRDRDRVELLGDGGGDGDQQAQPAEQADGPHVWKRALSKEKGSPELPAMRLTGSGWPCCFCSPSIRPASAASLVTGPSFIPPPDTLYTVVPACPRFRDRLKWLSGFVFLFVRLLLSFDLFPGSSEPFPFPAEYLRIVTSNKQTNKLVTKPPVGPTQGREKKVWGKNYFWRNIANSLISSYLQ